MTICYQQMQVKNLTQKEGRGGGSREGEMQDGSTLVIFCDTRLLRVY